MQVELSGAGAVRRRDALDRFLRPGIGADRYPLSPGLASLKAIFGEAGHPTTGSAGPNQFFTTAADPIGHESALFGSQGRSLNNNRRPDFGRRRPLRLFGADAGRLRILHQ
jgi:hypothetical protein